MLAQPEAEFALSKQAHRVAQCLFLAGTPLRRGALFGAAFSMLPSLAQQGLEQQPTGKMSIAIHLHIRDTKTRVNVLGSSLSCIVG